jgi:hypothetical protein
MFILAEGILRRGTVVGAIVTAVFVAASRGDATLELRSWHSIALAALCFLESTIGAGWLIGAIMWSVREQAARRSRERPR